MKKTKMVPTETRKTTFYCDLCELDEGGALPIPEGEHSLCDHCGKDLCKDHRKVFTRYLQWQTGSQIHVLPNLTISLCDECRAINMTIEEFLNTVLKEMKLRK